MHKGPRALLFLAAVLWLAGVVPAQQALHALGLEPDPQRAVRREEDRPRRGALRVLRMAFLARHLAMLPLERERRTTMPQPIEGGDAEPFLAMARATVDALS